jgi:hypothetical protein
MKMRRKGLFLCCFFICLFVLLTVCPFTNVFGVQETVLYSNGTSDTAYGVVQTNDGGFAVAGCTDSYGSGGEDFWLVKTDSAGNWQWSHTYGGTRDDIAYGMIQTSDGGFVLVGKTGSFGAGGEDVWLVKTDSSGKMLWNQTYGGTLWDYGWSVVQTRDGGFAMAGDTRSYGSGENDFFLVKTDSAGNQEWGRSFGGGGSDGAKSIVQTTDGGYALAGYTNSYGAGGWDFFLVRTDSAGNMQWSREYGGSESDEAESLIQTQNGGFALAGYTLSYGSGKKDFWVVETDFLGGYLWSATYGGSGDDAAKKIIATIDGGYALAGYGGNGDSNFWLVKTSSSGVRQWDRMYGTALNDQAYSVIQTSDGGYALTGFMTLPDSRESHFALERTDPVGTTLWSKKYGATNNNIVESFLTTSDGYFLVGYTDTEGSGARDFLVVHPDSYSSRFWSQTYGGAKDEVAYSISQAGEGGYAIAGTINSFGNGGEDALLVKTDSELNFQWSKTYGETVEDGATSVVHTTDGGFALAGYTSTSLSDKDFWLIKVDSSGNTQWSKAYGARGDDIAYSVIQTADGGYALAGCTSSYGAGKEDYWLVKTDSSGNEDWNCTFGGSENDVAFRVVQTSDGGFALAGSTESSGASGDNIWIVKTDPFGHWRWSNKYGGVGIDQSKCSFSQNGGAVFTLSGISKVAESGKETLTLFMVEAQAPFWNFDTITEALAIVVFGSAIILIILRATRKK